MEDRNVISEKSEKYFLTLSRSGQELLKSSATNDAAETLRPAALCGSSSAMAAWASPYDAAPDANAAASATSESRCTAAASANESSAAAVAKLSTSEAAALPRRAGDALCCARLL